MSSKTKNFLFPAKENEQLIKKLKTRFELNTHRHPEILWNDVLARLEAHPKKLISLFKMEETGGEPDVFDRNKVTGELIYYDFAKESPKGRRSTCYDRKAMKARKKFPPERNAIDMAGEMGIEILDETQYRKLQKLGDFDTKSSSWLRTPVDIRNLGGALFGDFRYGHVFIYHNGADSYFASRGFRGSLKV